MEERTFILLSVPNDFVEKLTGFISNINMLNDKPADPVVKIEQVYFKKKQDFAAIPKGYEKKEGG